MRQVPPFVSWFQLRYRLCRLQPSLTAAWSALPIHKPALPLLRHAFSHSDTDARLYLQRLSSARSF